MLENSAMCEHHPICLDAKQLYPEFVPFVKTQRLVMQEARKRFEQTQ